MVSKKRDVAQNHQSYFTLSSFLIAMATAAAPHSHMTRNLLMDILIPRFSRKATFDFTLAPFRFDSLR